MHHNSFDHGKLSEDGLQQLSSILQNPETPEDLKKKGLAILAHAGSVEALKILQEFCKKAEDVLKQWSYLAWEECRMFVVSELSEEPSGLIITGMGGSNNKLWIYFLLLPKEETTPFTPWQHKIIDNEFSLKARELDCEIENFDFQDQYVGMTALIPIDVAIATFVEQGISNCNSMGNFLLEHYYAGNVGIPEGEEIRIIISKVREG